MCPNCAKYKQLCIDLSDHEIGEFAEKDIICYKGYVFYMAPPERKHCLCSHYTIIRKDDKFYIINGNSVREYPKRICKYTAEKLYCKNICPRLITIPEIGNAIRIVIYGFCWLIYFEGRQVIETDSYQLFDLEGEIIKCFLNESNKIEHKNILVKYDDLPFPSVFENDEMTITITGYIGKCENKTL